MLTIDANVNLNLALSLTLAFGLGVIASLHCSIMCGAIYSSCDRHYKNPTPWFFQIGRLTSYLTLSLLFFSLGEFLVRPYLQQLGEFSLVFFGVVAISVIIVAYTKKLGPKQLPVLYKTKNYVTNWILKNRKSSLSLYNLLTGFFTALIPCGVYYGILFLSMSTGSLFEAFAFVIAFWFGTLPVMTWAHRKLGEFTHLRKRGFRMGLIALCLLITTFRFESFDVGINQFESWCNQIIVKLFL